MTRKETQRLKRERIIEENGIIFLDNVSKSYSSGSPALNGVSLSIGRGEFVFIVGDNAAMIGAAGYEAYLAGIRGGLDLNADPSLEFDWI